MTLIKNTVVTADLGNSTSSTFLVDTDEGTTVLLTHPLSLGVLIRVEKSKVNTTSASIKDSSERGIDYANGNRKFLDFNTTEDLDALGMYFALKRKLTPRQKQTLANICGIIASIRFNNDLREAMNFVVKNSSLLDEFNLMWFNNFKELFSGTRQITSKKQRGSIFNIAGYVLAELENPKAKARK